MMLFHSDLSSLFLYFGCLKLILGREIYITPSSNSSCPEQPCLILSQLANDFRNDLSSNVTLIFLPGSHNLQLELLIESIGEICMLPHPDFSQMPVILCGWLAKFTFENINLVYMSGLKFSGCGGNKAQSVGHFIIEHSIFLGQQNINGSALELVHTTANISKSSFIFNTCGSYHGPIGLYQLMSVQDPSSELTVYAFVGGALLVNQSNVDITSSIFEGNNAEVGGAIFSVDESNITVSNSTFVNNHAFYPYKLSFGGAIYSESGQYNPGRASMPISGSMVIINTEFIDNTATSEGGAVVAFYVNVGIHKCKLIRNSGSLGGAMMVQNAIVTIYHSQFDHNIAHYAVTGGGAVLVNDGTVVNITRSQFSNNTAWQGGALFAKSLSNVTITNSVFDRNTAQTHGGVLSSSTHSIVIIVQCQFHSNKALRQGGVVAANYHTIVIIHDSEFYNNEAHEFGGAINIVFHCQLIVVNSQFNESTALAGGVLYMALHSEASVSGSNFHNNSAYEFGGVFHLEDSSSISIKADQFLNSRAKNGGVVASLRQCTVYIIDSIVFDATAEFGGAVNMFDHCIVIVEGSQFSRCEASKSGGVIKALVLSGLRIRDSRFDSNKANIDGGVILVGNYSFVSINNSSQFDGNEAQRGGVIHIQTHSVAELSDSEFSGNLAQSGGAVNINTGSELSLRRMQINNNSASFVGGALTINPMSGTIIEDSAFVGNRAYVGGTLIIFQSNFTIHNSKISQTFASVGALYLTGSVAVFLGSNEFSDNFGSLYAVYSLVSFKGDTLFFNNTPYPDDLVKPQEGGAITIFQATVYCAGTSILKYNQAESGGAIHATNSRMFVYANVKIVNNTVSYSGGGIYLYRCDITCLYTGTVNLIGNTALQKGGGIYAISSSLEVFVNRGSNFPQTLLEFIENSAQIGGGLYLEAGTNLYVWKNGFRLNETITSTYNVLFIGNSADYGGAMSVSDDTNVGTCDSSKYTATSMRHASTAECFFQILDLQQSVSPEYALISINFKDNHALYTGSTLFGGLLDRCTASPFAEIYSKIFYTPAASDIINGVSYVKYISNLQVNSTSSKPVRVCFCKHGQPDCSYQHPEIQVKKGDLFTVTLVAVDQVNNTVSNTTIHSYLKHKSSGLGDGQLIQTTLDQCTDLNFSISTTHDFEQLVIYAEGPCKDASISQTSVSVRFLNCTCPIGFQRKDPYETKCVCECDSKLFSYVSNCDPQSRTVTKSSNSWISYVNSTEKSSGYLIYHHCPFDYCLPSTSDNEIKINLNEEDGADVQCAHNHAGILCGSCKRGFSLSLGSSRCVLCTHWHTNLFVILFATLLAGVILVALLLVLNLTVAIGTLNGIIFYANIVAANRSAFLPFLTPNFVTIFIAWLNLDMGIDTCFFEGMNAYWKSWVDLCFPAYLILLVAMVILICEYSTKFAQLVGRKNPVATLATVILLSYAKLLHTIITSFSFAILDYPDDSQDTVWLPDGTVGYLKGKHVALFVAAVLILLAGVVYTTILFSWQWLLHYQDKTILKWVRNQKLCHFLEPYHAPYSFEYRYWTGLLLLVRALLYITAALNVSNDPAINLLVIGCVMTGVLVLKSCLKRNKIYKRWPLELIEMTCYLNVTLFCLGSFYFLESRRYKTVVAYISGSITFTLFVVVLIYHIVTEVILKSRLWKSLRHRRPPSVAQDELDDDSDTDNELSETAALIAPTWTVVEAPPKEEQPLSALIDTSEVVTTQMDVT